MTPREQYEAYLVYLRMKIEQKDWHGVADAAMDLRELEASCPELKKDRDPPAPPKVAAAVEAPASIFNKANNR